jgi:hypothetical protein
MGTILYSMYLEYSPKKDKVGIDIMKAIKMLIKAQKTTFEKKLLASRVGVKAKLF